MPSWLNINEAAKTFFIWLRPFFGSMSKGEFVDLIWFWKHPGLNLQEYSLDTNIKLGFACVFLIKFLYVRMLSLEKITDAINWRYTSELYLYIMLIFIRLICRIRNKDNKKMCTQRVNLTQAHKK